MTRVREWHTPKPRILSRQKPLRSPRRRVLTPLGGGVALALLALLLVILAALAGCAPSDSLAPDAELVSCEQAAAKWCETMRRCDVVYPDWARDDLYEESDCYADWLAACPVMKSEDPQFFTAECMFTLESQFSQGPETATPDCSMFYDRDAPPLCP
jgi:hypothetical protein